MIVKQLWRYPVKSAQGHIADEVHVDALGVIGDRRWALRDLRSGNILTARSAPQLLEATGEAGGALVVEPGTIRTGDAVEIVS